MSWIQRVRATMRRLFGGSSVQIPPLTGISLPDSALAMRIGTCQPHDLQNAITVSRRTNGGAAISVAAADVPTQADLLKQVGQVGPCAERVSFTTMRRLRDAGFRVDLSGAPPHHLAWLPLGVSDDEAIRLFQDAFDPAVEVTTLLDGDSV